MQICVGSNAPGLAVLGECGRCDVYLYCCVKSRFRRALSKFSLSMLEQILLRWRISRSLCVQYLCPSEMSLFRKKCGKFIWIYQFNARRWKRSYCNVSKVYNIGVLWQSLYLNSLWCIFSLLIHFCIMVLSVMHCVGCLFIFFSINIYSSK